MATEDIRDEKNLKHFQARSQQPKLLAGNPDMYNQTPVNVFIVFDQGFGGVGNQIDDTRFNYMGVAPKFSPTEKMHGNRMKYGSLTPAFSW